MRSFTKPSSVRGTRFMIDVRAGRSSVTPTGISAVRSPARSTRRISSVSKRSWPERHARANGSTAVAAHRLDAVRVGHVQPEPDAQHRAEHRGRELAQRGPLVGRAFAALRADDDRRTVGLEHARDRGVEEAEVEEVGVEVHDRVAAAPTSSPARSARP